MTDLPFKVLRLVADGGFHSGESIARELGLSRTSVWNAVRILGERGIEVYKVRGRGYRLARPVSVLDADAVKSELGRDAARCVLHVLDTADSTNSATMQLSRDGAPSGTVVTAELQIAGRGRLGRRWHSGLADSLTFSVLLRFSQGAAFLSGLSLATGVAVARGLERVGVQDIALKWPNDVLWHGRKLAGILIEMQGDALGPSAVVVGVGLNVRAAPDTAAAAGQPVADLETVCGEAVDRNRVLAALIREIMDMAEVFSQSGFLPMREAWESRHAYRDRCILLTAPGAAPVQGIARGVGDDGALLIETGNGLRLVHSGEVSLRAMPEPGSMS